MAAGDSCNGTERTSLDPQRSRHASEAASAQDHARSTCCTAVLHLGPRSDADGVRLAPCLRNTAGPLRLGTRSRLQKCRLLPPMRSVRVRRGWCTAHTDAGYGGLERAAHRVQLRRAPLDARSEACDAHELPGHGQKCTRSNAHGRPPHCGRLAFSLRRGNARRHAAGQRLRVHQSDG